MELIDYVDETYEILSKIILDFQNYYDKIISKIDSNIEEIVFIASGSSYNAAKIASYYIENKLNLKVNLYYPNHFLNSYNKKFLSKKNLYILISQGGSTILVREALEVLNKKNMNTMALTAYDDSVIAKEAQIHVNIGCGDEKFLFRTIGVSCTLLMCYIISMIIYSKKNVDFNYKEEINLLSENIKNINLNIQNTKIWYKNNKSFIKDKKSVFFAGGNELFAISNEADIKFMEMIPIITRSYEIEEFIHGPQNSFDDNIAYFILYNRFSSSEKTLQILKYLKSKYKSVALVSDDLDFGNDIKILLNNNYFDVFNYLIVFQVLAYYYAKDNGRDLSKRINADIDTYVQKKL